MDLCINKSTFRNTGETEECHIDKNELRSIHLYSGMFIPLKFANAKGRFLVKKP
jgi:hypothetical protein